MKFNINFVDGAFCEILSNVDNKYNVQFIDNGTNFPNQIPLVDEFNKYYVQFIDKDTDKVIYDDVIKSNMWCKSSYTYFINYKIKIIDFKSKLTIEEIDYNANDKRVYIWFDSKSLGDNLGWIPYVEEFRKKHNCILYCSTFFNYLFKEIYPDINFVEPGTSVENLYASYPIGCFEHKHGNKVKWKSLNNQEICSNILGLKFEELKPPLKVQNKERKTVQKYVCISTKSTAFCKEWQYKNGWKEIVLYLNSKGYKVIVLQKESVDLINDTDLDIELCGSVDLNEPINLLYNCDFFIGLSSGMSWLAWCLNKPCILVSGMSKETTEFFTPFRVINKNVCHGCWSDDRYEFDRTDWWWCPKLKNTDREYECSKSITPKMIIDNIEKILYN